MNQIGLKQMTFFRRLGSVGKLYVLAFGFLAGIQVPGQAQQFNSDNYWTTPEGMGTVIVTMGQRHTLFLDTFSLIKHWEFSLGGTMFREDTDIDRAAYYQLTGYAKYTIFENQAKNGGAAVKFGVGARPGYYQSEDLTSDLQEYWGEFPLTVAFHGDDVLLDLIPGGSYSQNFGNTNNNAAGFTYSSRLAVYKIIPRCAVVGELFGTEGEAYSPTQYKTGVRWESPALLISLSYGDGLKGNSGAGWEIGFISYWGTPSDAFIGK
ncbi:MAG: hypothetical protein KBG07_07445 [Elusimicrobia bacterium]|nr:hypothetical protein [Elusimicrobiota bacterium]